MKIKEIHLFVVNIPFKFSIDHHLKKRSTTESIIIQVTSSDGISGYGEGAPRSYVTGETIEGVLENFREKLALVELPVIAHLKDIETLLTRLETLNIQPSLMAALEIAMLDLFGQTHSQNITDFWGEAHTHQPQYSAVLPYGSPEKVEQWLYRIKDLGLRQVKVKVGGQADLPTIRQTREILGNNIDIRVDANRAWSYAGALNILSQLADLGVRAVEEPLREEFVSQLPKLSKRSPVPLMLDESVFTLSQAQYYAHHIDSDKLIFNLKLSKCGGLLRTGRLHQFARAKGIACQLGCNVGETAVLSAAGRIFAQAHSLKYLEGSYGPLFLQDDISTTPMGFSQNGLAPILVGPGLGVVVDQDRLNHYTTISRSIKSASEAIRTQTKPISSHV